MEDIFGFILVFVIFVLGPLLEQLKRKNAPPPQDQPRKKPRIVAEPEAEKRSSLPRPERPRQTYAEPQGRRPRQVNAEQKSTSARNSEAPASEMLPDELWKILSGEARPTKVPRPPAPDVEDESTGLEEEYRSENLPTEIERGRKVEAVTRAEHKRDIPYVVSMETTPDPKARHTAFHQKIAPAVARVTEQPVNRNTAWLKSNDDLRRAIIVQTILGSPKGLE